MLREAAAPSRVKRGPTVPGLLWGLVQSALLVLGVGTVLVLD